MTKILHTFTNNDDGLEAYVTLGDYGYHVSLKDTDADEFVPTAIAFKDEARAIEKAKEILG